ncbi:hypothetical protein PGQ11_012700 [Apiospora arundinis]|uniref:Uncharacterized protein n=1 Tax=Apiospora arundinis TaxID=335852 RepID=A0ABR2I3V7_9PEZI
MANLITFYFLFHVFLVQFSIASVQNFTSPPTPNATCLYNWCKFDGLGGKVYGWWDSLDPENFEDHFLNPQAAIPTFTATIVTVIKTSTNVTSVHTVMPPGWVAPPTNAEGTRIQTVIYTSADVVQTTILAYPTVSIRWPESYLYSSWMEYPASEATGVSCNTWNTPTTVAITAPTPQFTSGSEFNYWKGMYGDTKTLSDPRGLFVAPVTVVGFHAWPLLQFRFLFSDQPALHNCTDVPGGPAWGGFVTQWAVATATSYMD